MSNYYEPQEGDTLTLREWQAVTLAAQGMTAKEMARHLGLSPRTTEIFRRHAVTKIGGRTMGHAIAIAISDGITSLNAEVREEAPARASKEYAAAWLQGDAK